MNISKKRITDIKNLFKKLDYDIIINDSNKNSNFNTRGVISCNDDRSLVIDRNKRHYQSRICFVFKDIDATLGWDGTIQDELDIFLEGVLNGYTKMENYLFSETS